MLRHVVGWSGPVIALIALFLVSVVAGPGGIVISAVGGLLVGVAAELHARLGPSFGGVANRLGFTLWVLPDLLVLTVGLALVFFPGLDPTVVQVLPLVGAVLVGLVVLAQDREAQAHQELGGWPRLVLGVMTYLAAFGLFTLIYQTRERSLVTATSTALISVMLATVLLRSTTAGRSRTVLYAAIVGLSAGEMVWALNYWVVIAATGGAVLLVFFYVFVGVADGILNRELNGRLLIEYVGVGLLGFLLTLSTAPWRP
ncbi:MAG: hypothetical protein U0821_07335 [Chloroflexota bacterium]